MNSFENLTKRIENGERVYYTEFLEALGFDTSGLPDIQAYWDKDGFHEYDTGLSLDLGQEVYVVIDRRGPNWMLDQDIISIPSVCYSEDLIAINSSHGSVLDDTRLSLIKRQNTSIKYELEIEPNATIRTYNYDTPEILFNEWFNDVSSSDKRKEKRMSDNTVSPILSMIEERIKQLKQLELDMDSIKSDIQKHNDVIGKLSFKHDELNEDICHVNDRINLLLKQARIEEGFTEEYLSQFIKECGY